MNVGKFSAFICLLLCASSCGAVSETAVESTTTQASTITSGFTSTTLPQTTTTTTATTMATTTATPTTTVKSDSLKDTKPDKRPPDRYSCNVNDQGFCIFTGQPHPNYLKPRSSTVVDLEGSELFLVEEAVAVNSQGEMLIARGTPAFDGDQMSQKTHSTLSEDEKAFHRVMATMFGIRNQLMYNVENLNKEKWDMYVEPLTEREIKETTFTDGATPRDNYYGRDGIFELVKNPNGRDIHHDVMKFLEESGLYLLCHVTSQEFNQMLADTHPEGHDPCEDAGIENKIPWDLNETVATPTSEWKPGKYLDRHCESLEEEDDGCRADLMMEIGMGAEVVRHPDSSEQLYGVSQYLRIFDLMEDNPTTGQFGLWGQWIGSLGAHPNGAFNSIEGGLFIHDKMGRSKFPKYMASAATHLYSSDSDTGGGWGFYERRIDCSVLGRITIANRMIVPPNLIAFDEDQETHDSEGGIFVGTSWVALPLINGSPRVDGQPKSTDEGLMTWTFVIDADNYSGPLIAYVPEHWSRRLDRWNAMEILDDVYEAENEGWDLESPLAKTLIDFLDGEVSNSQLHSSIEDEEWYGGWGGEKEFGSPHWVRKEDTLGYSPARGYIPTGIEMPPIPTFKVETPDGRIFLKIFPPQIPNETISEAFVLNVQTFDVNLYNHFLKTFQQPDDASNFKINFDGLGIPMQVEGWDENPWEGIEIIDLEAFEDPYEANLELRVPLLPVNKNGETNILFNWQKDQKSERGWSNYFEVKNGVPTPVSENEVPEQIKQLEYETLRHPTSLMSHENVTDQWFDSSCFTCVDATGCDATKYQTLLDDGSRITYRWYRFMDQPAFDHLSIEYPEKYSDDSLNELQKVVEAIHREWGSDHKLIERPIVFDNKNLAEVDHGLIVEPPPGKEIGWVPIVLEVELPDGIWQEEIDAPRWKEGKFYPR